MRTARVRGFGLLECLAALLVFSLGISGALAALVQAQRLSTEAVLTLRALSLGEEWLSRAALHSALRDELPAALAAVQTPAATAESSTAAACDAAALLSDWWRRALDAAPSPALPAVQVCAGRVSEWVDLVLGWEVPRAEGESPTAVGIAALAVPDSCMGAGRSRLRLRAYPAGLH